MKPESQVLASQFSLANDNDYQQALQQVELWMKAEKGSDEGLKLDCLVDAIVEYEALHVLKPTTRPAHR